MLSKYYLAAFVVARRCRFEKSLEKISISFDILQHFTSPKRLVFVLCLTILFERRVRNLQRTDRTSKRNLVLQSLNRQIDCWLESLDRSIISSLSVTMK